MKEKLEKTNKTLGCGHINYLPYILVCRSIYYNKETDLMVWLDKWATNIQITDTRHTQTQQAHTHTKTHTHVHTQKTTEKERCRP